MTTQMLPCCVKIMINSKNNRPVKFRNLLFQDHDTDPEYRWGYGKLRRTGTTYVRVGQEHLKCKTGVFIDVFPMDDIPHSTIGQMLNDFYCFCLRKFCGLK